MAKQFSYQLREDLSVSQIISFVAKLKDNHLLINKGYLKLGEYPTINQLNFEVTYDKSKESIEGNVPPYVLLNILYKLNSLIVTYTKKKGCPFVLPLENTVLNDRPELKPYDLFFFQPPYNDANTTTNKNILEDLIYVFNAVVTGALRGSSTETTVVKKPDPISKLSYNLRQGDLIEAWTKEKGAKQFANLLLSLPVSDLLVPGDEFGPEYQGESYAFEHAYEALNEFYKKFKEFIKTHDNYGHPDGSEEKKALNRLESKQDPYFSGRSVIELVTISNEQLTGKLSTDNSKIQEYIEIIETAIKSLKKDVPPTPTGGSVDDVDGGEASEEEQKDPFKKAREENKIIDFDQLYLIVKDQLVIYIFEKYYQEFIDKLADKYTIRKALLKIISDKVDANFNLKVRLREKLDTTWGKQIKDDEIINDEALASQIEAFVVELASTLYIAEDETEDIKKVINPEVYEDIESAILGRENFESTEEKTQVKGVSPNTSAAIVSELVEKGKIDENFSEENWEKLTLSEKITFWQKLTLSERAEFVNSLVKKSFIDNPNIYAQRIAEEIIDDQLAQRNIKKSENLNLADISAKIQATVAAELLNIPPSEFMGDPELFIRNQRKNLYFPKLYSLLDLELKDYLRHFPDQKITKLSVSENNLTGITSIEEAAKLVNPTLNSNEEIYKRFEDASIEVFRLIDVNFGHNFNLPNDDFGQSLNDIRPYLLEFLLSEHGQEGLYILYNKTQLNLFISKYGDEFIKSYGQYFLPQIKERYNEAHRKKILDQVEQFTEGGSLSARQIDEALHFILTEAVQSQIDPEKYINSLSDEKLLTLFNAPKGLDQAQINIFRDLIKEYLKVLSDIYNLDELIYDSGEYDEDDFDEGVSFYQQQTRRNASPVNSGRSVFQAVSATGLTPDEMAEMEEAEYQELNRNAQNRRSLALAIWQAYSEEERAFLEQQNAQQMAVYEWEKMLRDQRALKQPTGGKKKPENRTRKIFKKGVDKAIISGSTAALGLIPGVGTAAAGLIKILPIPNKYKKYIAGGLLATAAGWLYTVYSSIGGIIGGALGGIAGFLAAGPAGIAPGLLIGGNIGFAVQKYLGGFGSNVSAFFNNIGDGFGINNVGDGFGINTSAGAGRIIPGGPIGTEASSIANVSNSIFGTTAGVSFAATIGTGVIGGIMITYNIHTAFLMRPPEFISINQDPAYKYVQVEKRVNKSTMENGEISDLTYSVTISPRDNFILTVNQATDNIIILGTDSNQYDFQVDQAQITEQLQPSSEISTPVTIQYTIPNVSGTDIALNNTFLLDFSVEDEGVITDYKVQDSASVIIGNPKLGCYIFGEADVSIPGAFNSTNTSIDWTDVEKQYIANAFQKVVDSAQFMSLACNGGPITLYRYRNSNGQNGGYSISETGDSIGFYDFLKYNNIQPIVDYTLIHELGHSINKKNPGIQNSFQSIWQGSCFTYDLKNSDDDCFVREAFPEAIALYTIHSYYEFKSGKYNFPTINPREYTWIENNIYGGGN
ncbi:MAG: hypothetical protein GW942_02165 [Candidatus Pacebacteria bacterium]|nr:hypothetical protein [Candidatus Paceibacterota bacterium]